MTTGLAAFLEGVRVVDMSRHLPGPLATLLLADMGAQVVKVEPPEGDDLRTISPPVASGRSPSFDALNAGKTSRRIDLKTEAGKEELLALTDAADVVVESFRPGVLDRLGVGFAAMRARNPGLVCCAMSGFGRDGVLSRQPAHDINFVALAGVLSYSGNAAAPSIPSPPLADFTASFVALSAILGALHKRRGDGVGCEIDLAIADCVMIPQIMQLAELRGGADGPARGGEFNTGAAAYYNIYATRDGGTVALGAMEPRFWRNFCRAAGRDDWGPRHGDPLPQTSLIAEVASLFASMMQAEAVARFAAVECCFSPVLTLPQATSTTQAATRRLVVNGRDGIVQALFPVHVDGKPPRPRQPFADSPPHRAAQPDRDKII